MIPFLGADGMVRPRGNDEAHLFIEFYRGRPPGWSLAGRPLHVGSVYPDQVPFFRIHLGPAALKRRLVPGATPGAPAPPGAPAQAPAWLVSSDVANGGAPSIGSRRRPGILSTGP